MAGNSEKSATKQRGPGKPFAKGQSGNPTGRPKVVEEFKERCRRAVDERVISAWISEVESLGDSWLKASELLAAYGYGRPAQSVELAGKDGGPLEIIIRDEGAHAD